ncbi:UPF0481 protein At3g47200-like [Cicer arietinum]|uniref:UPF0481 protein At3g47200-like n=1 Tax=Cicer arietinum TaxID=3827 RepID=A0A1S3EDI6_CICAR|nr:UPF0481 protein At3g47200-like [Cicer arietinum]
MPSDFGWMVPIEVMLGSLNHGEVQACSISIIPDKLREVNEDAYKPTHISIGPLHRGATRLLQLMEEPKWHYMNKFLDRQGTIQEQNRKPELRLRECGFDILKLDKIVRASYGGGSNNIIEKTKEHDIAKIMIVDGCFLLELLIRLGDYTENQATTSYNNDIIFKTEEKVLSILNDVTMLANQIPFLVLKKLYRKVFPDGSVIEDDHRVANIVRKAFGYPSVNRSGGAHILHLMHLSTVDQNQQHEGKKAEIELLRCATRLRASGVIIRPKLNSTNQNQHKFVDMFDFDISFSDSGELDIPPLYVKETTEVKWRNLIAWEQSKIWIQCKYTSYALFFNGLICCEHDIELLKEKRIIVNEVNKSNKDLLTLFHTISKGAEHMDLSYNEICGMLNDYKYKGMKVAEVLRKFPINAWHQWRRIFDIVVYYVGNWYNILIRDHIPTVWKFIGIVAAAILLVLTIMQTYYSSRTKD